MDSQRTRFRPVNTANVGKILCWIACAEVVVDSVETEKKMETMISLFGPKKPMKLSVRITIVNNTEVTQNKFHSSHKVSTKTGTEQEESYLSESATQETSQNSQVLDLENNVNKDEFIRELLGLNGEILKQLEEETCTKVAILERGSMLNETEKGKLRSDGKHSTDVEELRVEIQAHAPLSKAFLRVSNFLLKLSGHVFPSLDSEKLDELHQLASGPACGVGPESYRSSSITSDSTPPSKPQVLGISKKPEHDVSDCEDGGCYDAWAALTGLVFDESQFCDDCVCGGLNEEYENLFSEAKRLKLDYENLSMLLKEKRSRYDEKLKFLAENWKTMEEV
ncbi:hypothetical protein V9T40_012791 [Parthenolecanium corni]|uniref:Uncharacterized protein n=1 Tax=Parthenolecanium corni TaxID=536013 RepID=A0AAN9TA75_9HEMI